MDSFWNNTENDGYKTIDRFPKQFIERMDNNNMRIILKNGSTFQVLGATDPDKLRGANAKLYIFSEFVDIDSTAYEVIVPIIEVNGGQVILQSTPKIDGISGGTFKTMFDSAKRHMDLGGKLEFCSIITAKEYLSDEALERLRQKNIEKYGNDFFFRQEFLCDWGQASSGSYYGGVLALAESRGRIGDFPYNPSFPCYTAWDLGIRDSIAIGMFQYYKKTPRIIDYFETSDVGYRSVVEFLKTKPYNFKWHFFPHDAAQREMDAQQRIQKWREAGLINSSLLQREPRDVGIKRMVDSIPKTLFNEGTTGDMRRKWGLYKRKFNPVTGDYIGPEHKTESHAADFGRYMYGAIEHFFDKETGEFLISPSNEETTYESESIITPSHWSF